LKSTCPKLTQQIDLVCSINRKDMEEQPILGIINYLGKGAGTSFIFYMILRFLKKLRPILKPLRTITSNIRKPNPTKELRKRRLNQSG
jgi:hypothetical protein